MEKFDCIVVGAGVNGSSTANSLARRGKKTLLLEKFPLPHSRGSSHGQSRIIRKLYSEPWFASMMPDAYSHWETLAKQFDTQLIVPNKCVFFEAPPYKVLKEMDETLGRLGAKYEKLSPDELKRRLPMIQNDTPYSAIREEGSGILMADRCLLALQKAFRSNGGILRDGESVIDIIPGPVVTIKTTKGTYQTPKLIITAGPWTNKILKPTGLKLPLTVERVRVCYWKADPDVYNYRKFPSFVFLGVAPKFKKRADIFGLAAFEYPDMIKVCVHGGAEIDPDHRDLKDHEQWDLEHLKTFVATHFQNVESTPSISEVCIYTITPDETFILDFHPKHPNIVIGAGFSGTGFKLGPVVGEILADMSEGKKTKHDVKPFRLSRFSEATTAKL